MGARSFQEFSPADLAEWEAWDRQNSRSKQENGSRQFLINAQAAQRISQTPSVTLTQDDELAWSEFLEGKSQRYRHESSNLEQPLNRPSVRRAPVGENAAFHLDKRIVSKLAAGKLNPESVLDLHGKTVVEALRAITPFVISSRNAKLRLILIITGKGHRSQDEMGLKFGVGKLKQATQVLLESRELRRHVQFFQLAHRRHGGSGAFYVYLRRK